MTTEPKNPRNQVGILQLEDMDPKERMTLETFNATHPSLEKARDHGLKLVNREKKWGMLMIGKPGIGKTHLMIGLMRQAIENDVSVRWLNALKFVHEVQASYSDPSLPNRAKLIKRIAGAELLFLDDLGKERSSEDVDTLLYELLEEMMKRERRLIASTNLDVHEFSARYDDATKDRINGICWVTKVQGTSGRVGADPRYRDE